MSEWKTPDGRVITDEMISKWDESYEQGEFPEGEKTVSSVVYGKPPKSNEAMVTFSMKIPAGMKAALEKAAAKEGISMGSYARGALTDKLLASA